jgi:HK97 family phage portal protein
MKLLQAIKKSILSFQEVMNETADDDFVERGMDKVIHHDPYLYHAWVNIAVNILIRNIARASFVVKRNGEDVTEGKLYELFRRPNEGLSCVDLWKETAAWWSLEGEAFWWFGVEYGGGVPREIHVINPRRMRHEIQRQGSDGVSNPCRWFYETDSGLVPIMRDEIIHFRDWNPWNSVRGVNPLVSLSLELEQDYWANRANSDLLKNGAVPQGIIKTDQVIRPEEADAIERRWENKFGSSKANRKIAVLGKGSNFEAISFSPEVVRLFDLKRWNLYTILAKYGIPPRVANINDRGSSLSGQDSKEQHAAFWKFTLVPLLKQFENILDTQLFARLGLSETCVFNLNDIPELQESEDEQSKRDIAEINAGLKTINDVLRERGKETKPWGDIWYRNKNLVSV